MICILALLLSGCVIGGATICEGTQKKNGDTSRVEFGAGIKAEAKGGSCR